MLFPGCGTPAVKERHWFWSLDIAGLDLRDIESSFFDQILNRAVQVAAAGNPLPNWI
jgi:hypothetical protein